MYENVENIILLVISISGIILTLYLIFRSPFKYPYFEFTFDVTGKRKPDIESLIDEFLNQKKIYAMEIHYQVHILQLF